MNIDKRFVMTEKETKDKKPKQPVEMIYVQLHDTVSAYMICNVMVYPYVKQFDNTGKPIPPVFYAFPKEYQNYIQVNFGDVVNFYTKEEVEALEAQDAINAIADFVEMEETAFLQRIEYTMDQLFLVSCLDYALANGLKMKAKLIESKINEITTINNKNTSRRNQPVPGFAGRVW